jgi:pyruvate dehydrogenase E2 component (dihydrolipoamide acetyltransferase)
MYEVTMPKLSDSMEEGKIIEWKVSEGDEVHEGDVLAEVESDKAVMELECFHDGTLAEIKYGDDSEVPVGAVIALIDSEGAGGGEQEQKASEDEKEQARAPKAEQEKPEQKEEEERAEEKEKVEEETAEGKPEEEEREEQEDKREEPADKEKPAAEEKKPEKEERPEKAPKKKAGPKKPRKEKTAREPETEGPEVPQAFKAISPYAKKLADDHDIDYQLLKGSGPDGRIIAEDVEAAAKVLKPGAKAPEKPARPRPDDELPELDVADGEADVEEMPFRLKTQALRVTNSQHVIPHFYITRSADVTGLVGRKDDLKKQHGATITHLVEYATIKALGEHPEINRSYDHGRVIKWKHVNLGLAVATDQGLTVAVVHEAESLSLPDLIERSKDLVDRARAGKLKADERRHPGLTITNLGMFDVENFEPIINPPSSITLAVSSARPDTVVRNDEIHVGRVMKLTASCDHRIVDGAAAAKFLATLAGYLEHPDELLG